MQWSIGDRIDWLHEPRGGYGYIIRVPGVVRKVTSKRVQIEVQKATGETVMRSVMADRLRDRVRPKAID